MDPRIRLTLKLIDEYNPRLPFDLSAASKMMGLSEPYLLRLFRREVGWTLTSHVKEVRISRAAQLLKLSSQPIKTIACECGYDDISNFYRDFKSVYSVTPREMRLKELTALVDSQVPALSKHLSSRPAAT